ncbi:MAG: hypothetical protein CMP23_00715 [Rickettsiales bacterium]|nr:hypothetical protein [Rickettsiales bacterium]|tara:strand:- start:657 stop:1703 length:1047 start_codon:yes stop_codon:yes gene_type:complete
MATSNSASDQGLTLASQALVALLFVAVFMLPSTGQAQYKDPAEQFGPELRRLIDPLDQSPFEARTVLSTNGLGGYDSDGCSYARGPQPRSFAIATSPTTGFSAPIGRFPAVLTEAEKKRVRLVIAEFGSLQQILAMPASGGYEIAAAIAGSLGASAYDIGELYLQGAWTVRDTIVGFLPGLQGAGDTWRKMGEVSRLAQQQVDPAPRTRALFDLARISHRGGFFYERESFLKLLSTVPDAGLNAVEKRAEFRRRVALEQRLLQRAREQFERGVQAGQGSAADRSYYLYLVGDIDRRQGRFEAAQRAFAAVVKDSATAEEVRVLVEDIQAVLKVQERQQVQSSDGGEGL